MIVYRELAPDEYDKIPSQYRDALNPRLTCVVVGAFDGEELVGLIGISGIVFVDPIWVREDHRQSPSILRRITDKAHEVLRRLGVQHCYTWIVDGDKPAKRYAEFFGGQPFLKNGSLYQWRNESWVEQHKR